MRQVKRYLWVAAALLGGFTAAGQAHRLTVTDAAYQAFADPNSPNGVRFLEPESLQDLQWVEGTDHFIYNKLDSYVVCNAQGEQLRVIGDVLPQHFPFLRQAPAIKYVSGEELVFKDGDTYYRYDFMGDKVLPAIHFPKDADHLEYNPLRKVVAYTLGNNLYLASPEEKQIAVTSFKDKNIVAGQAIHRKEFGITKGTFFSPKGNFLAFYQKDESRIADYAFVNYDTVPAQPKVIKYAFAGGPNEKASIGIYDFATKKVHYLQVDNKDDHYLTNLAWSPDEKYILLAEVDRDQSHFALNRYEVATGKKVNTLFEERNSKWVEPESAAVFLSNKNDEFLWLSERSGFTNVYHYNLNGKLIKQLTNFKWVVQSVAGFDAKGENVFIVGTSPDAREKHVYKVNIKSPKKVVQLTKVAGTHEASLSSDGKYLLDVYSNITTPEVTQVISTDNGVAKEVHKAANPFEGLAIGTTELVSLKADDGTVLYGRLHKPSHLEANKKYPVLIYVYGGPHAQEVTNSWLGGAQLWMPVFAESEDYIVFSVDNRGSENRGFAFESVIHRHLGDVEIKDQLKGVDYLKSLPYVDGNRIAVYGWSFGGFMASSLITRAPEVFKAAVAGGAVTDWSLYEAMYGERYMDMPQENLEGYANSRVMKYINKLEGKLLLIHGSVDDTVVPQHFINLVQASLRAKKSVDMFVYPMQAHGVRGLDYVNLLQRITDYIKANNK